jgi:hypothetical protein
MVSNSVDRRGFGTNLASVRDAGSAGMRREDGQTGHDQPPSASSLNCTSWRAELSLAGSAVSASL